VTDKAKCPRCHKKHEVFKHPDLPYIDAVKCGRVTLMLRANDNIKSTDDKRKE
jgi:Zn ribbon nucleic-acid-binding protein